MPEVPFRQSFGTQRSPRGNAFGFRSRTCLLPLPLALRQTEQVPLLCFNRTCPSIFAPVCLSLRVGIPDTPMGLLLQFFQTLLVVQHQLSIHISFFPRLPRHSPEPIAAAQTSTGTVLYLLRSLSELPTDNTLTGTAPTTGAACVKACKPLPSKKGDWACLEQGPLLCQNPVRHC